MFKPSDDLWVNYLSTNEFRTNRTNRTNETNETPIIPRSDCNEQGVCVCDAINSIRDSVENDGRSPTPTIRPNSGPTCGITGSLDYNEARSQIFCTSIQGTLELYSPEIISGGVISNQGWASAITAGCITTMIILSMMI